MTYVVSVKRTFEETNGVLSVDLTTGRMPPNALFQVPIQHRVRLHILETELTQEDLVELPVIVRIR